MARAGKSARVATKGSQHRRPLRAGKHLKHLKHLKTRVNPPKKIDLAKEINSMYQRPNLGSEEYYLESSSSESSEDEEASATMGNIPRFQYTYCLQDASCALELGADDF